MVVPKIMCNLKFSQITYFTILSISRYRLYTSNIFKNSYSKFGKLPILNHGYSQNCIIVPNVIAYTIYITNKTQEYLYYPIDHLYFII